MDIGRKHIIGFIFLGFVFYLMFMFLIMSSGCSSRYQDINVFVYDGGINGRCFEVKITFERSDLNCNEEIRFEVINYNIVKEVTKHNYNDYEYIGYFSDSLVEGYKDPIIFWRNK